LEDLLATVSAAHEETFCSGFWSHEEKAGQVEDFTGKDHCYAFSSGVKVKALGSLKVHSCDNVAKVTIGTDYN